MSQNTPNPQGKGLSPILANLDAQRVIADQVPPKHIEQVSAELFTSLFILESTFRFQPVVGKPYYLYEQPDQFWLALTPPTRLGESVAGRFIGVCELQSDLTWTLELADAVANDEAFMAFLADKRAAFERDLEAADTMADSLPTFKRNTSFYGQAFAYGLSHSLGSSMAQSGIRELGYREAQGLIANRRQDTTDSDAS
ncbi:DUF2452 domain-containing protein [Salinisphaera sp. USBA-960]|uniref:DUF2452 domain-containing protein n=1 Tax=Salinisphaera orenii TaxID=856731 RepID=UPI000DBE772E|nr:DUF2452 domain-containing protein [Salifodinibacter halophilus]NNC25741.1 DUF2452 domain-containing protein [Salifodinibacter halophilus]